MNAFYIISTALIAYFFNQPSKYYHNPKNHSRWVYSCLTPMLNGYDREQTMLLLTSYYGRNPSPQELAVNETLRIMLHLELSWFLFSRPDLSELDQAAWQQLYQDTIAQSLHDFAITHDNEELEHDDVNLQTEALTKLKYFLQQDLI